MSDGKFFGITPDLSDEERISVLERKISVALDKFQIYDRIIMEFQIIRSEMDSMILSHSEMKNFLNQHSEKSKSDMSRLEETLNSSSDSLRKDHSDIKKRQDSLVLSLNNYTSSFHSIVDNVGDQVKSKADKSLVDELGTKISTIKNDHLFLENKMGLIESLKDSLRSQDNTIRELNEKISSMDASLSDGDRNLSHLYEDHSLLSSDINKFKESVKGYVENLVSTRSASLEKKIDDLKTAIQPLQQQKTSLSTEVSQRLDLASLDASNAILKASNSAQQISILEKKIESILLNLKKIELSK